MKNQTVLITGVSRGIGRATALAFGKAGYCVAGCSKSNVEALSSLKAELTKLKVPHCILQGDISDPSFVSRLFSECISSFGHLDILINNAGISKVGLLSDMTDADINEILSVNLASVLYCCRNAVPHFLKNRCEDLPFSAAGRILNISSIFGCSGASCEVAYSATKGGINALTEGLAKELAMSNISVNALACGVIDTDMNSALTKDDRAALAEEIPAGRFASSEEVADALLKLSQMPVYLTGQIIRFDGGLI